MNIEIDMCDIDVVQTPLEEEEEEEPPCQTPVPNVEKTKQRQKRKQKQKQPFLQTSSVPPSTEHHHRGHINKKDAQSVTDLQFDSLMELRKAFSLPHETQHTQSSSNGTTAALTMTMSTTVREIDTHYACNRLIEHRNKDSLNSSTAELTEMTPEECSQQTPSTRLKLIGIPSQVDDVIVELKNLQNDRNPFRTHHKQNRSRSNVSKSCVSRTRGSNASGMTSTGKSKSFGIESTDEEDDDDDPTLNTDMLILNHAAHSMYEYAAHERNGTNVSVSYNCNESSSTKPKSQQNMCIHIHYDDDDDDDDEVVDDDGMIVMDVNNDADNDDSGDGDGGGMPCFQPMEEHKNDDDFSLRIDDEDEDEEDKEEDDFFPSPGDFDRDTMMKKGHNTSRSLLDELSKFALNGVFGATSKNSFSNSKSTKSRKILNELIQKRRSRSMPSMEELNNDSNDSNDSGVEDGAADQDDRGDIISLLSVLVKHGFYTKTNLNSVQQLTVYNAKQ